MQDACPGRVCCGDLPCWVASGCQIPPGTVREEPEDPWNSLPRVPAQAQPRYEVTPLVFSMMRIQQLWGSSFGKSNNQHYLKGCGCLCLHIHMNFSPSPSGMLHLWVPCQERLSHSTSLWMSSQVGQYQDAFTALQHQVSGFPLQLWALHRSLHTR